MGGGRWRGGDGGEVVMVVGDYDRATKKKTSMIGVGFWTGKVGQGI